MEQISRIGIDTSKHIFQLHGVDAAEKPVLRSGHVLLERRRHGARRAVVTMCIAGGMGTAGLLEIT